MTTLKRNYKSIVLTISIFLLLLYVFGSLQVMVWSNYKESSCAIERIVHPDSKCKEYLEDSWAYKMSNDFWKDVDRLFGYKED